MQFEVPQFIEIEDKVIGPLTWKQFVYIAGGSGLLVILFLSMPFMLFLLLGLPVAALSASLAFHRVNNRPFSVFLEAAANYFTKGRLYLWRREIMQSVIEKKERYTTQSPHITSVQQKSIPSLTHKLDLHQSER